ncbi:MAG: beta-N-acetylhexosaminidase [Candidatus Sulfotelmatobacter sp.]
MRLTWVFAALILFCTASASVRDAASTRRQTVQHDLMPLPMSVTFEEGQLKIDGSFTITVTGYSDARLEAAIDRMARRMERRTGIEFASGLAMDASKATLVIQCQAAGKEVPALEEDESYSLEVTAQRANLKSETVVGAMRGMETLLQLVAGDREGYYFPLAKIADKPRFPWRGLLIDVSRHFQPEEVIKRNIDGMAALKLNVLHWHLTDDQGFRVESFAYPKLHGMGSEGLYYSQNQVREIVSYAQSRGIRVVPEFDVPGHTTSWFVGYPELASAPGPYHIQHRFGVHDGAMDPTREEVYKFLDKFLGEMATLFPDAYIHIGGDESNGKQWKSNPKIQSFMESKGLKDRNALQAYFNQRLLKILQKHHKKMIGWDEMLHRDLPKDVIVQSWRDVKYLHATAKQGYNAILSAPYYLDDMAPASDYYLADPIPANSDLTPEQAARILGGEACMWGEEITPETIDSRIWPRLAAVAERLWSPQTATDVQDMYRRLAIVSVQLEAFGLTHRSMPESLLRRIAEAQDPGPLRTLWEVTEPVPLGTRETTQTTPMTHMVDATVPDPVSRREYEDMVDGLLSDAPQFRTYREKLAERLAALRDLPPTMAVMIDRSPILKETEPLVREASNLGEAGLEALSYLSAKVAPPAGWEQSKLSALEEASKPRAGMFLAVAGPIRQLIIAAGEIDRLQSRRAKAKAGRPYAPRGMCR